MNFSGIELPDKPYYQMLKKLKQFISFLACSTCEYPCVVNKVCRFGKWR